MSERIVVFGYGPTGRATVARLLREGREVAVSQRNKPSDLPEGAAFIASDAIVRDAVIAAAKGADQIVVAIGVPYVGKVWQETWPRAVGNFVAACETTGARMVFIDNLYMYGPQSAPLIEATPLSNYGVKPAARSVATRIWMEAAAAGRVRVASLRPPDFYGPGTGNSFLGDTSIGAMANGKAAMFIGSPDIRHDYAYVPDIGRAAASLLAAPDDAFGQVWHMPCAPTRTTREILAIAAEALGVPLRIRSIPEWSLPPLGLVSPFMRELREMRFTFDRPYLVDATKFKNRFWSDSTPFETGVRETALAFRAEAKSKGS
jgi:nucleoside-diphosphate-sugar epimerase